MARDPQSWRELGQRDQHERSLGDPRVRQGKRGGVQLPVVIGQQIDVDQARPPATRRLPPETLLDGLRLFDQQLWLEWRPQQAAQVQKLGLLQVAPWLGLVHRRDGDHFAQRAQFVERGAQYGGTIADVAAQAEIDSCHARGVSQVQ
jgi:hypothetical protein